MLDQIGTNRYHSALNSNFVPYVYMLPSNRHNPQSNSLFTPVAPMFLMFQKQWHDNFTKPLWNQWSVMYCGRRELHEDVQDLSQFARISRTESGTENVYDV